MYVGRNCLALGFALHNIRSVVFLRSSANRSICASGSAAIFKLVQPKMLRSRLRALLTSCKPNSGRQAHYVVIIERRAGLGSTALREVTAQCEEAATTEAG